MPIPSRDGLLKGIEDGVLATVDAALLVLRSRPNLPLDEKFLNRELCIEIYKILEDRLIPDEYIPPPLPFFDAPIGPNADSVRGMPHASEQKRPDFTFRLVDDAVVTTRLAYFDYHVECKRLGCGTTSAPLTQLYVIEGVNRFTREEHRYGYGTASGAMVGYLQDGDFDTIHGAINDVLTAQTLNQLIVAEHNQGVNRYGHSFERTYPSSPFSLRHSWVDLRDIQIQQVPNPPVRERSRTGRPSTKKSAERMNSLPNKRNRKKGS